MSFRELRAIVFESIELVIPLDGLIHKSTTDRLHYLESSKTQSIGQFSKSVKAMRYGIQKKRQKIGQQKVSVVKNFLGSHTLSFGEGSTTSYWPRLVKAVTDWFESDLDEFINSVQISMRQNGEVATPSRVARKLDSLEQKFLEVLIPKDQVSEIVFDARAHRRYSLRSNRQTRKLQVAQEGRKAALSAFLSGEDEVLHEHWPETMHFFGSRKYKSFGDFVDEYKDVFRYVSQLSPGELNQADMGIFTFLEEFEFFLKDDERIQLCRKIERLAVKQIENRPMQQQLLNHSDYVREVREQRKVRGNEKTTVGNFSFVERLNERYYSLFGAER